MNTSNPIKLKYDSYYLVLMYGATGSGKTYTMDGKLNEKSVESRGKVLWHYIKMFIYLM